MNNIPIWQHYFDFLDEDDIRVKGTRVGIETILGDYLTGDSAESIAKRYPTLSLEQVYATITYYLGHREEIDAYLEAGEQWFETQWQAQLSDPLVQRLRLQKRVLQLSSM